MEDLVKNMAAQNTQFMQQTQASIQSLETHIGQLATSLSKVNSQGFSQLPSQIVNNLRGNVSAITLRSGKEVQAPT